MTEYIELGGKLRPVSFAHRQQRLYEEAFGSTYLKDVRVLMSQFAPIIGEDDADRITGMAGDISLVLLGNLFYSALLCGCSLEKVSVDFDVYDVTDWIGEYPDAVTKMMNLFVFANTSTLKSEVSDASKKKKVTGQAKI